MENEKYRLTDDSKFVDDVEVFRIEALNDFGDVKAGDLGGFIESENDLLSDIEDESWVYDDAVVYGYDRQGKGYISPRGVAKNSKVMGESVVKNSIILEGAVIRDSKIIGGMVKDSNVSKSEIINESNVIGCKDIEGTKIDNSSLITMDEVRGGSFKNSIAQLSEVNNTVMEDSSIMESTIVDSNVYDSVIDGSEIRDSYFENSDKLNESVSHYVSRRDLELTDGDLKGLNDSSLEL